METGTSLKNGYHTSLKSWLSVLPKDTRTVRSVWNTKVQNKGIINDNNKGKPNPNHSDLFVLLNFFMDLINAASVLEKKPHTSVVSK